MKRLLTACILIPFIAYVIVWAPQWLFLGVVAALAVLCYLEYRAIANAHGAEVGLWLGLVPGIGFLLLDRRLDLALVGLTLLLLTVGLRNGNLAHSLPFASGTLLGVGYIFGCWRSAIGLRAVNPYWLLFAVSINWVGDTAAYYVGSAIGKHRLASRVSPKKSWEGAVASILVSVVYGVSFLHYLLPAVPLWQAALLSAAGNVAGQVGDLAESALKRGAGVKDSGNLLPGHGGWLDRVDSTLFSMPAIHLLLSL